MYDVAELMQGNILLMIPIFITLLCLTTRLIFIGKYLEGWDDVDFALSLHDYDLASYQPHFPGYILFIAFAMIASLFVENDAMALALPNVIFGSLTVIPLYLLVSQMSSRKAAMLTVTLYAINPLCWLQSERPLPDISALFFIILSAQLIYFSIKNLPNSSRYMMSGSLALAIALGIKPSYFPFIITWAVILWLLIRNQYSNKKDLNSINIWSCINSTTSYINKTLCPRGLKMKYYAALFMQGYYNRDVFILSISSFAIGVCVWIVPLLASMGIRSFLIEGSCFTAGHFTDWGGSINTQDDIIFRLKALYGGIFVNGLGFCGTEINNINFIRIAPPLTILILMSIYLYKIFKPKFLQTAILAQPATPSPQHATNNLRLATPNVYFIIAFILPYFIWLFFGQNLENPRHSLPIIVFVLILISAGITNLNLSPILKIAAASMLLINFTLISTDLIVKFRNQLPPQLHLVNYVKENFDINSTRIYCWETKRLFDYYAPYWDVRMVRNADDLEYDLRSSLVNPKLILCTSEIQGIDRHKNNIVLLNKFRKDRHINNVYAKLDLYRLDKNELSINQITNKMD